MLNYDQHANLLQVTVSVTPTSPTTTTTIPISNSDRTALLAVLSAPFNATLGAATGRTPANCEIVRITAVGAADSYSSGNASLTVTRSAETGGQSGHSVASGDLLEVSVTAKTITDIENNTSINSSFANFVQSGLTIPTSAGLSSTSVAGVLFYGGIYVSVASDGGHTYTASKDTYVDVDKTGAYTYTAVSNGASAPALTANSVRIAKVVSGASSITSVLQDGSRDSNNVVIYPNLPGVAALISTVKARVYRTTSAQSVANTTFTKIQFNAKTYDPGSNFDATTNYRFTAPVAGYYDVVGGAIFSSMTDGHRGILEIYKNGSEVTESQQHSGSANDMSVQIRDIIFLAKNDYIELYAYQDTGGSINLANNAAQTYLSIHLLSI